MYLIYIVQVVLCVCHMMRQRKDVKWIKRMVQVGASRIDESLFDNVVVAERESV